MSELKNEKMQKMEKTEKHYPQALLSDSDSELAAPPSDFNSSDSSHSRRRVDLVDLVTSSSSSGSGSDSDSGLDSRRGWTRALSRSSPPTQAPPARAVAAPT